MAPFGALPMSELAERLAICRAPAATRARWIRLKRKELLKRRPSPDDRRSQTVDLSRTNGRTARRRSPRRDRKPPMTDSTAS